VTNEEAAAIIEKMPAYGADKAEALVLAIAALRSPAPGAEAMREACAAKIRELELEARKGGDREEEAAFNFAFHTIRSLPLPAPEVPECHGCKHWTVDKQAKDFDKSNQYGTCRGMRGCGVEIETTGDCSVDAICTDATFCCKGWEAR